MFGASQVAYSGDGTWAALYHQATAGGGNTALLMLPTGPSTKAVLGTDTNINMVGAANGFVVGSLQNGAPRVALVRDARLPEPEPPLLVLPCHQVY